MPNQVRSQESSAEDPPGAHGLPTTEVSRGGIAPARRARALRRAGRTVAITATTALGLAIALAACASSGTIGTASAGSTVAGKPIAPSPTSSPAASGSGSSVPGVSGSTLPSPSVPGGGTGSVNPGGPNISGQIGSPVAQAGSIPTGAKYVPIEQIGRSSDGRTLYLEITAQAGACGRYVVVVQESSSQVEVGLAHLPVKVGVMCPMLVRIADFPAKLSAPLGNRPVIDLATGKAAGTVGVIPLPLPESGNPAGL